jgi:hypothetical protein
MQLMMRSKRESTVYGVQMWLNSGETGIPNWQWRVAKLLSTDGNCQEEKSCPAGRSGFTTSSSSSLDYSGTLVQPMNSAAHMAGSHHE